jgi:hypothetical protein
MKVREDLLWNLIINWKRKINNNMLYLKGWLRNCKRIKGNLIQITTLNKTQLMFMNKR